MGRGNGGEDFKREYITWEALSFFFLPAVSNIIASWHEGGWGRLKSLHTLVELPFN